MMKLVATAAICRKGCGGVGGTNSGTGDDKERWAEVSIDAM
jgi:hypothetical protein